VQKIVRLLLITSLCSHFRLHCQLEIDTAYTSEELVTKILLTNSAEWEISNVRYKGSKHSIGVFKCNLKYNDIIEKGIILSTGNVFDAIGPNTKDDKSGWVQIHPDKQLEQIAKGKTYDAAILQFDFVAKSDSITFNFFFASEEYPEYVNKNVNDVFGFFLQNLETKTESNIALIKPGNIPITVDNINSTKNKNWYMKNGSWNENYVEQWAKNKQLGELAYTFQFDGFTKLISVSAHTIAGKKYSLKLAIADVGDRNYDSGIFIEAGSFKSGGLIENNSSVPLPRLVKGLNLPAIQADDNTFIVNYNIQFDTDSFRIKGNESFIMLNQVAMIMKKNKSVKLEVSGHTDQSGKTEHNLKLSKLRAASVRNYLIVKGIESERISHAGYGSSKPINKESASENRRVEFVFKAE
jgi:outer membrane protein OmpA-like peptidoglycan-associated protein